MITGDYEKLKGIARDNVCAEHKMPLVIAWHSETKAWVLRCSVCQYPNVVSRNPSLTEEWRQGKEVPSTLEDNIVKGIKRRQSMESRQVIPFELQGIPNKDLATGKELDEATIRSLVAYASKYHLDVYRSHVVLMYGKPYITIDGYLWHANQARRPYNLKSRPMTTDELKTFKLKETDHGWISEVYILDTNEVFMGIGVVTYDEMTEKSKKDPDQLRSPVVAAHPWQLGQKRAEWQALRRAFPIGESGESKDECFRGGLGE